MRILCILLLIIVSMSNAADIPFHDKDHPWGFSADYTRRDAWEQRADFLRHQAMVAQGLWPAPPKTPLNPVIHGSIDRDGYTIQKVYFTSLPGHYVTGNLYLPKGKTGKLPAVLCPYGHWPDGRFWWRDQAGIDKEIKSGAETDPIAAKSPLQASCAMLARMGCIVFTYDMVGYGDSTKIPHREGFLDAESILRLQSFMGLQTWNSVRSLDFVLSLPDVDPSRIAVTGSSSGGTQTIALDAVDPRTTVAFPMVMVSMNMQGGCVCENAPLYRVMTNNVELATLFAPKPEGMAAANDWTIDFMTRGLPEMKKIWGLFGAESQVEGAHFVFPHNHNLHSRLAQYSFLNKELKLGWPEPLKEVPFEPVPPKELSVYDDAHPRPADEADAKTLRDYMTRTTEEQLAAMSDDEYRKTLLVALEAMVVRQLSDAPATNPETTDAPTKDAVLIWTSDHGTEITIGDQIQHSDLSTSPQPPTTKSTKKDPNPPYAGFTLCYNRSLLAQRVCDLVDAIVTARKESPGKSVHLLATDHQGTAALLALCLADGVDRAAIDLNEFDFDKVTRPDDPMLLPGALKYGGVYGFVPLVRAPNLFLCRALGQKVSRKTISKVTRLTEGRGVGELKQWLAEQQ